MDKTQHQQPTDGGDPAEPMADSAALRLEALMARIRGEDASAYARGVDDGLRMALSVLETAGALTGAKNEAVVIALRSLLGSASALEAAKSHERRIAAAAPCRLRGVRRGHGGRS